MSFAPALSTPDAPGLAALLPPLYRELVRGYLRDDAPAFDVGGFVVGSAEREARLLCKHRGAAPCVLAGRPFADVVFEELGLKVDWLFKEGSVLGGGEDEGAAEAVAPAPAPIVVATVKGPANRLLLAERTVLNIMSRASGVASQAFSLSSLARAAGWHGEVVGTRKTTPGFRAVEKYALLVGGCGTHRMDLSAMVMLKDNHVWAVGSVGGAVRTARRACGFSSKIEVEARGLGEALEAAEAGADIVMLDNYATPAALVADAARLKALHPHVLVEASGGITRATLPSYFDRSVDVVSLGALTQGYACVDFSLKVSH
jgi:nicotinate-nucleotide pyrophosphorylase (carboxylating)